eukprot:2674125-Rhodomonas_salina.1
MSLNIINTCEPRGFWNPTIYLLGSQPSNNKNEKDLANHQPVPGAANRRSVPRIQGHRVASHRRIQTWRSVCAAAAPSPRTARLSPQSVVGEMERIEGEEEEEEEEEEERVGEGEEGGGRRRRREEGGGRREEMKRGACGRASGRSGRLQECAVA